MTLKRALRITGLLAAVPLVLALRVFLALPESCGTLAPPAVRRLPVIPVQLLQMLLGQRRTVPALRTFPASAEGRRLYVPLPVPRSVPVPR